MIIGQIYIIGGMVQILHINTPAIAEAIQNPLDQTRKLKKKSYGSFNFK